MSTAQRIDELIGLLIKGTADGSLTWQLTADENTFRLASSAANVRVTSSEDFVPEAEQSLLSRRLLILNDKARVIEEYVPQTTEQVKQFDSLFVQAKRSAYKTDEVLDKLMIELRQTVS